VLEIIEAIKSVDGIMDQKVSVVDYVGADELNKILASLPLAKDITKKP
jgi:copper chaperone CopZ